MEKCPVHISKNIPFDNAHHPEKPHDILERDIELGIARFTGTRTAVEEHVIVAYALITRPVFVVLEPLEVAVVASLDHVYAPGLDERIVMAPEPPETKINKKNPIN